MPNMSSKQSKTMIRHRLGRWGFVRCCIAAAASCVIIGACGGDAATPLLLGGESHFLQQCTPGAEPSCGPDLDCISGVCTRGCLVNEASCSDLFAAAACTPASIEPGAVAVCDVSCSNEGDCAALGARHRCEGGFCRAPEGAGGAGGASNVGGAANGGVTGLGGQGATAGTTETGAGGRSTDATACAAFRDNPGTVEVEVVIRNERSTPVYVHHVGCNYSPYRVVEFDRPVRLAEGACLRRCQDIQDDGQWTIPCPDEEPCGGAARIRIDPGAELSAGQYGSELVTYTDATAMPWTCAAPDDLIVTPPCYAATPMAGAYRASATASSLLDCPQDPRDGECSCTPDATGTCVIGTGQGGGELLTSTVDFTMPSTRATITFRDE